MTKIFSCRSCGKSYPLTPVYFRRASKNATGYSLRCKPCDSAYARKSRAAREAVMTKAEFRAEQERRRAIKRAWRAANRERDRALALKYRRLNGIPRDLAELERLQTLTRFRDDAAWRAEVERTNQRLRAKYAADPAGTVSDPDYVSLFQLERELMRLVAKHGRDFLNRRIEELKERIASYSPDEIEAALKRAGVNHTGMNQGDRTMASWCSRTSHLPSFATDHGIRARRRWSGYELAPGVEVRPGRGGSEVLVLKAGAPAEIDTTATLMAELEAQKRSRQSRE